MSGPRYSIIPADALSDKRIGDLHLRVLALLGSYSDNNGWLQVGQKTIAERAGCARESINRTIRDLVEFGYLRKTGRVGQDGRRLVNYYQVLMDREVPPKSDEIAEGDTPPVIAGSQGVCDPTITGYVTPKDHRVCDPQRSQQVNDPFLERPLSSKDDGRAGAQSPPVSKSRRKGNSQKPDRISWRQALDEVF